MFNPSQVPHWMVIVYERQQRFNDQVANQMVTGLVNGCEAVGAAT
jgi:eukaryotic translation initiation factor 2C